MREKILCLMAVMLFAASLSCASVVPEKTGEPIPAAQAADRAPTSYTSHAPININGNSQFSPNATNGVAGGTGTPTDPFVIEGWDINASSTLGIQIRNTTAHFIVRNCSVRDGGWYAYGVGIYISNTTNGRIENCTITKNDFAMLLDAPNMNITIARNEIFDNYYGIFLFDAENDTLSYNRIFSTQGNAIVMSNSCTNNVVFHNDILNNYFNGIYISSSSSNNTISYNNITSSFKYAVSIMDSHYNSINHNNFIGNNQASSMRDPAHVQANDSAGMNFWNTSSGGNYWSDWTGPDNSPKDGIVDAPYSIDGGTGANDSLPLASPVGNAGAVPEFFSLPLPFIIVSAVFYAIFVIYHRRRYVK